MATDDKSGEVILYHMPPSFYSQLARLVLAEKSVRHEAKLVFAGPPTCESYEPWYMRLNPGGTVPTLVVDGQVVGDSRDILHEVDRRFDGPQLTPQDGEERETMERWIERGYSLPERVSTYGNSRWKNFGAKANLRRRKALVEQRGKNPDMGDVYDAKIADIDSFIADTEDAAGVEVVHLAYESALDDLEAWLVDRTYICGETYTLADLVWTVTVARRHMLGSAPLEGRLSLSTWYARMKARPSFKGGDVWERFRPNKIAKALWGRFFG